MNEKAINKLKSAFTVSEAMFNLKHTLLLIFNKDVKKHPMHLLHIEMLNELNKESPSFVRVDFLLTEMETEAERNKT